MGLQGHNSGAGEDLTYAKDANGIKTAHLQWQILIGVIASRRIR
jgi:hypothetical protein